MKGYRRRWVNGSLDHSKREHKGFGMPMHEILPKWADQLTFYSWTLGAGMEASPAGIDEVLFHKGEVQIISYRAWLTAEWKQGLRSRLVKAWDKIQNEDLVNLNIDPDLLLSVM